MEFIKNHPAIFLIISYVPYLLYQIFGINKDMKDFEMQEYKDIQKK